MKVVASGSWFRWCRVGVAKLLCSGAISGASFLGCQPPPPAVSPNQTAYTNGTSPSATEGNVPSSSVTASSPGQASDKQNPGDGSWWSVPYPGVFDAAILENRPSRVAVKGNRFVDESGDTLVFHGVNISDPDKLARDGHWSKRHFEAVANWGATIVRIPVHPAAWRGRGKDAYFALLDDAVRWANALHLYVIIDWHSIGNLRTGMFQHPMHQTTIQETNEFWRAVSHRYAGVSTVAFYELFNEPTLYNGTLGSMTWSEWKGLVEEMVSIIQAHDPNVIPLVSGFDWAYDLSDAVKQPINRKGIGYVSHPYPEKTSDPFEKNWDRDFGAVSKRYPLFATEIGYMPHNAPGAHVPVKDDGTYGKRITDYLDKKGASWTAWCFEPDWPPQLISDWNYTPTEAGNHFRSVMLEKAKVKAANQQLLAEAAASKKALEEQQEANRNALALQKAAEQKAAEQKAAEQKAAEQKAAEQKAAEQKVSAAQQAPEASAPAKPETQPPSAAPDARGAQANAPAATVAPVTPKPPAPATSPSPAPATNPTSASAGSNSASKPPRVPSTNAPAATKPAPKVNPQKPAQATPKASRPK